MPRLTEQEQQEIIRFLEADKPLPDKYRFLLFEDKLRQTRPFVTKDQGYLIPKKSVSNRIIGDSRFELLFARFLEDCGDVVSYGKNYLAEHFKLDYVNADGDISNYYPDFLVKLSAKRIFIVETKGQERPGRAAEDATAAAMVRRHQWIADRGGIRFCLRRPGKLRAI